MTQCQLENSGLGTVVISTPMFLPPSKADSVKVCLANYPTSGGGLTVPGHSPTHCFI